MHEPIRIVFVCVENSCRSQMAEGFARALAPRGVEVYSAGSRPSGQVNADAIRLMAEHGIDISRQESKGLDDLPPLPFAAAITMGCGDACPALLAAHREDWALPDPKHLSAPAFRQVRDEIRSRTRELLVRLGIEPNE
jgi:arsenate reductase (thioredoxin)